MSTDLFGSTHSPVSCLQIQMCCVSFIVLYCVCISLCVVVVLCVVYVVVVY
jgi:hypothetical protein